MTKKQIQKAGQNETDETIRHLLAELTILSVATRQYFLLFLIVIFIIVYLL